MAKFALLSEPRSGTTFFNSVMRRHPDVHAFGEILPGIGPPHQFHEFWLNKIKEDPMNIRIEFFYRMFDEYLRYLPSLAPEASCIGVDIKYYQAQWKFDMMDVLRQHGYKIIHLVRRNILKRHVSRSLHEPAIRKKLGRTLHESKTGQQVKIAIPPGNALLNTLTEYKHNIERFREMLSNTFPYLELTFEDILDEETNGINKAALDQLFDFLEIDNRVYDLGSEMKKLNPKQLRHSVANYHEVVSTLLGTEFEWMLDDPAKDAALAPAYALVNTGEIKLMSGSAAGAKEAFAKASELAPDLPDPVYLLGLVTLAGGALGEGVDILKRGLAMTSGKPGHGYFLTMLETTPMDAKTQKIVELLTRENQ